MKLLLFFLTILINLDANQINHTFKFRHESAFLIEDASIQKSIFYAKTDTKMQINNRSRLVLITKIESDLKDSIEPGRFDNNSYNRFSKVSSIGSKGTFELRELFVEHELADDILLKVGKMQTVWGKADGIKLIDILNPQTFTEFILPSFDESRIALWSVTLLKSFENSEFEIVWIADNTRDKLPKSRASYAFTTPKLIPQVDQSINIIMDKTKNPNNSLLDSDIALRYSMMFNSSEVGFFLFHLYDDLPTFSTKYDKSANILYIRPRYERKNSFAINYDLSKDKFVYRVEAIVTHNDKASYLFGVDWYGFEESILSFQFNQSYLFKKNSNLVQNSIENTLTFLYKKDMFNNTLHNEILTIHNVNDGDGLIKTKTAYELDEESLIYANFEKFYGSSRGLYGEFKDESRVVVGLEYTF